MTWNRLLVLAFALGCASSSPSPSPTACLGPGPGSGQGGVASTAWWNGAAVYEVFVRSFQDSNGDGKGDLQGLISRLDYLNSGDPSTTTDLGVDAIWLMPIFASPSYHGYDTTDYESIDPDYGTLDDFNRLVAEAHRRGMKVILDLVANHTSSQHPWFVDSASSPASAHRSWYVWSATDPGWTQPWGGSTPAWHPLNGAFYYGVFWSGMPDLDYRTVAVREEMKRIAKLWLDRGADGFRLDAARHIVEDGAGDLQVDTPETHAWWKEFSASVRAVKPDASLVGEAWTDTAHIASYYGSTAAVPGGDELPLLFDFPLAAAVLQGVRTAHANTIACSLAAVQAAYPRGAADAPFLTNHDQKRVASELAGDTGKLAAAAAILLTLPGTPFLYYGEELGMQNGPGDNDEWKRTPMAWDGTATGGFTTGSPWYPLAPGVAGTNVAAETGDPGSLLSRYRAFLRARKKSPALLRGAATLLESGNPSVLAFVRAGEGDTVLVAHNLGASPASAGPFSLNGGAAEPIFLDSGTVIDGASGTWSISLPPRGSGVWRLR